MTELDKVIDFICSIPIEKWEYGSSNILITNFKGYFFQLYNDNYIPYIGINNFIYWLESKKQVDKILFLIHKINNYISDIDYPKRQGFLTKFLKEMEKGK